MIALIKHLLNCSGVDKTILVVLLSKGWSILAGPITIYFLVRHLSTFEQGFYYTFASILGIKIFFELGIGNVTLLAASHEKSKLDWTNERVLTGDAQHLDRIAQLFCKASRIYLLISLLVPFVIWPIGYHFFSQSEHTHQVTWKGPWLLLCVLSSINLWSAFVTSFLEGCDKVSEISKLRLRVSVISSLSIWLVLYSGGSLYAAASGVLADLLLVGLFLVFRYRHLIMSLLTRKTSVSDNQFSWRREIWPMQWRMAISFVSGYLMFQLFNPLIFHFCGAQEAGRMGMSINLVSAVLTAALAWMNTKASTFGSLAANSSWANLDSLFFKTLKQSFFVLFVGLCAMALGHIFLQYQMPDYADRLISLPSFLLLLLATAGNHLLFSMALYLRAHRKDPYVVLSLVSGILIACMSYVFAPIWGVFGVTLCYALITWFVGVGYGTKVFRVCRAQWH